MYTKRFTPDELKQKIESHFRSKGYKADLTEKIRTRSGKQIKSITYRGKFHTNKYFELGFNVPFDGKYEPVIRRTDRLHSDEYNQILLEISRAVRSH